MAAALFVTSALVWLMQHLLEVRDAGFGAAQTVRLNPIVRVIPERDEVRPQPRFEPPLLAPDPPPAPMLEFTPAERRAPEFVTERINPVIRVELEDPRVIESSGKGKDDGDVFAIVKVEPVYPRIALANGVEGFAVVEYTVTSQGTTRHHRVIDSEPDGVFEKAAVQAAEKFRYKPRYSHGEPVDVRGIRSRFIFEIEEDEPPAMQSAAVEEGDGSIFP
jgi:protein TonB